MKKILATATLALLLVPFAASAQTVSPTNAQLLSLIETLTKQVQILESQLESLEAEQAQTASIAAAASSTAAAAIQAATPPAPVITPPATPPPGFEFMPGGTCLRSIRHPENFACGG